MKVFRDINSFSACGSMIVSTGTFDGVHLGHKTIISKMTDLAKEHKLQTLIITFEPHPRIALNKDTNQLRLLNTTTEKLKLLEECGVDNVFLVNFTYEFSQKNFDEFIKDYLVDVFHSKYIVIGFDHRFGANRTGNHKILLGLAKQYSYNVVEIAPLKKDEVIISSTKIRNLIQSCRIEEANQYLGYKYMLNGKVVKGKQFGQKIGFPTANISIQDPYKLIPANGVYAVEVEIHGKKYYGMCNIGFKPTFKNSELSVETHIFDMNENIYDCDIQLRFISFIRKEMKFDNIEMLRNQLITDKQNILEILKKKQ